MNRKFQVFISSTYVDLVDERQRAVEAVLAAGHIPAGMELFSAGDNSQKEVIKKWIMDSDIYMLILGGRYGSIDEDSGLSYTNWEYNYAVELGKPIISFVLSDDYINRQITEGILDINDIDLSNPKYINFKKEIMNRMIKFISKKEEIKGEVLLSLIELKGNYTNLVGWIKADDIRSTEEEYTISIYYWLKDIEEQGINKIKDEAFSLNRILFPVSINTPARPVFSKNDDSVGKLVFIIKTPNLYVAEQRRQQFESILGKHKSLISVELERFKGFSELEEKL